MTKYSNNWVKPQHNRDLTHSNAPIRTKLIKSKINKSTITTCSRKWVQLRRTSRADIFWPPGDQFTQPWRTRPESKAEIVMIITIVIKSGGDSSVQCVHEAEKKKSPGKQPLRGVTLLLSSGWRQAFLLFRAARITHRRAGTLLSTVNNVWRQYYLSWELLIWHYFS